MEKIFSPKPSLFSVISKAAIDLTPWIHDSSTWAPWEPKLLQLMSKETSTMVSLHARPNNKFLKQKSCKLFQIGCRRFRCSNEKPTWAHPMVICKTTYLWTSARWKMWKTVWKTAAILCFFWYWTHYEKRLNAPDS